MERREAILFCVKFFGDLAKGRDPYGFNALCNLAAFQRKRTFPPVNTHDNPTSTPKITQTVASSLSPPLSRSQVSNKRSPIDPLDELLAGGVDDSFEGIFPFVPLSFGNSCELSRTILII
jgi:hypothetical protein